MNWRAFPSVYMGEGSVSVVNRISQLKLKQPCSSSHYCFFPCFSPHPSGKSLPQPNRICPKWTDDTEVWILQCRLPELVSESLCLCCVENRATVMQNKFPMLSLTVQYLITRHCSVPYAYSNACFLSHVFIFCTDSFWLICMPVCFHRGTLY